MLLKQLL